jgi:hypothetical protein
MWRLLKKLDGFEKAGPLLAVVPGSAPVFEVAVAYE